MPLLEELASALDDRAWVLPRPIGAEAVSAAAEELLDHRYRRSRSREGRPAVTVDRAVNPSKYPRLNRLFRSSGNCLDVAVDHGVFNEYSFLDGLRDMPAVVEALVAARPDAIQMNIGQADLLQARARQGPTRLSSLRVDVGNPYNPTTHRVMFDQFQDDANPILGALKMDAAMVVCNLLILPDEPELHRQTVHNVGPPQNALRHLRHAADGRAADHAHERRAGRLPGQRGQVAHRAARSPGPRARR